MYYFSNTFVIKCGVLQFQFIIRISTIIKKVNINVKYSKYSGITENNIINIFLSIT